MSTDSVSQLDEVLTRAAGPADAAPVIRAARPTAAVAGLGPSLPSWLAADGNSGGPAAAPFVWTAAAFARREFEGKAQSPAAATTSGEPAGDPLVGPAGG
ncbi:hypothetical protein, partial [Mycobacterium sp. M26]|uniref:hypothetical protein n=1 Tax=Mycobacterium sp. M26 TaxID=1762962 RepID=UPI0018D23B53